MDNELNLDQIPSWPQAVILYDLLPHLWQQPGVQALWLEGSLARGNPDRYSDVDLYVGVASEQFDGWRELAVAPLFGDHYAAHLFSHFAADFFVYHVYLRDGSICDLHIQPVSRVLPSSQRLLLACREPSYGAALLAAASAIPDTLGIAAQRLDPTTIQSVIVGYWIAADKSRKVLYRHQDFTGYTGLHLFRHMLARLLYMEQTGADCGDLTRGTIHALKAAALALHPLLPTGLAELLGAAALNRLEMCQAQARISQEVARVGRVLAEKYPFAYPLALEQIVQQNWQNFIQEVQVDDKVIR